MQCSDGLLQDCFGQRIRLAQAQVVASRLQQQQVAHGVQAESIRMPVVVGSTRLTPMGEGRKFARKSAGNIYSMP